MVGKVLAMRPPRSGTAYQTILDLLKTTKCLWGWSGPGVAPPANVLSVAKLVFNLFVCCV